LWQVGVLLLALTLGSAAISSTLSPAMLGTFAMFGLAAIKAELVLDRFMEAGSAERHWQWLFRLWIGVVMALLAIGFSI
jgi:hypothetical protein